MGSSFLGIRGFCQRQEKQNAQKKVLSMWLLLHAARVV